MNKLEEMLYNQLENDDAHKIMLLMLTVAKAHDKTLYMIILIMYYGIIRLISCLQLKKKDFCFQARRKKEGYFGHKLWMIPKIIHPKSNSFGSEE